MPTLGDTDGTLREIVIEAIRELEETKIKFSEVTEKLKYCENKLNNVLNVMLKCGTLTGGTNSKPCSQVEKGNMGFTNGPVSSSNQTPHPSGQNYCIEEAVRNIKTEPSEATEDLTSCHSARKRHSDYVAVGDFAEGLNKRQKNDTFVPKVKENTHDLAQSVHNRIAAGIVIPVVGNSGQVDVSVVGNSVQDDVAVVGNTAQDEHCIEPEKNKDFSLNGSNCLFSHLSDVICQRTLDAVERIGFTKMTDVQMRVIPLILSGRNIVVSSKRSSGKTLSFLIPVIEIIYRMNFTSYDGTGCVIICPTNELVMQTYGVLMALMQFHQASYGMLLQARWKKDSFMSDTDQFGRGVNILVSTPGKFVDCLSLKRGNFTKLQCVVVDDSDVVLSSCAKAMKKIFNLIPCEMTSNKQIVLFTSNEIPNSKEVDMFLGHEKLFITMDTNGTCPVANGIEHYYMNCEIQNCTFLIFKILEKWYKSEKVVVIFSSAFCVNYFGHWLPMLGIPVSVISKRYGKEDQIKTFLSFCSANTGVLLCHSFLSTGLDIPAVSWVIQYDCPSIKDYINNAGLTARGINGKGKSLLLLYPSSKKFLYDLRENGIFAKRHVFTDVESGIETFNQKLKGFVNSNKMLKKLAKRVVCACVVNRKYCSNMSQQQSLNLANAFGLQELPSSMKSGIGTRKLKVKTKAKGKTVKKESLVKQKKKQKTKKMTLLKK